MKIDEEQIKKIVKSFPFYYVSCGYFRLKGVKKKVRAPILHGEEAIRAAIEHAINSIVNSQEK